MPKYYVICFKLISSLHFFRIQLFLKVLSFNTGIQSILRVTYLQQCNVALNIGDNISNGLLSRTI